MKEVSHGQDGVLALRVAISAGNASMPAIRAPSFTGSFVHGGSTWRRRSFRRGVANDFLGRRRQKRSWSAATVDEARPSPQGVFMRPQPLLPPCGWGRARFTSPPFLAATAIPGWCAS